MRLAPTPADIAKDGPGIFRLEDIGKERYAYLEWRKLQVRERVPLHFWKMNQSAKEMETRRITAALIKKLKRVFGVAPQEIVGAEDLDQGFRPSSSPMMISPDPEPPA